VNDSTVLDRAVVEDLLRSTGDDPGFLHELIDTFLIDSTALLAAMREASDAQHADELRRAAHTLKSNSASFGARSLASLCEQLERAARDGVVDDAAERVQRIQTAFMELESELRTLG
jgi:HPt (histidine-containing phosphotransfer) domain-containing protein